MTAPGQLWLRLRASLWFVPTLVVLASMWCAVLLVGTGMVGDELTRHWPRIFGAGADGSRAMLAAIATSMITVAGVVFSITIVALSQASVQYSPRVLRNFMRDRLTQWVLGVFVGNFAYCLLVLRTVRGGDDNNFIPALAVVAAMLYALVAICLLIYFIHHVAQSIQASSIISRIAQDAERAIDHLFPDTVGDDAPQRQESEVALPSRWNFIHAHRSGYVTAVAAEPLLKAALEANRTIRLRVTIGEFVMHGGVLADVSGDAPPEESLADRVRDCVGIDRQRTPEQDAGFCIQQLVDVAVKALSPGINDPTTACMCIDQLGVLVLRIARRRMPSPYRRHHGHVRVIAPSPTHRELVVQAFGAIIHHARQDVQVLSRVLDQVDAVADRLQDPHRRRDLAMVARWVARSLPRPHPSIHARLVHARARQVATRLRSGQPGCPSSGMEKPVRGGG